MLGQKASFWLAVAGVSILANFGLELLAHKVQIPGLQKFVQFTHAGTGKEGN